MQRVGGVRVRVRDDHERERGSLRLGGSEDLPCALGQALAYTDVNLDRCQQRVGGVRVRDDYERERGGLRLGGPEDLPCALGQTLAWIDFNRVKC